MSGSATESYKEFHRKTAATCNNAAWDLLERAELDAAELSELITLAATARFHWNKVGTPGNIAHADLLFAWALARAGSGSAALHLAQQTLAHFNSPESAPWERAFAHAAMAAACDCCGDQSGLQQHRAHAEELGSQLSEKNAAAFQAAFMTLPLG